MKVSNRNWLPPWPVVPPRLWLTAAGGMMAGLSLLFQQEIWPYHPRAGLWGWLALGLLVQAVGIQLIRVLMGWLRAYTGPRWVQLVMAGVVYPACFAMGLLLLGLCVLTCVLLVSTLTS